MTDVRYPSGAVGCVSNKYEDGRWRVVCQQEPKPSFATRREAADAEQAIVEALARQPTVERPQGASA